MNVYPRRMMPLQRHRGEFYYGKGLILKKLYFHHHGEPPVFGSALAFGGSSVSKVSKRANGDGQMGHMLASGNCACWRDTHRQKGIWLSWAKDDAAYPRKSGSLIAEQSLAHTYSVVLPKLGQIQFPMVLKKLGRISREKRLYRPSEFWISITMFTLRGPVRVSAGWNAWCARNLSIP